MAMRFGRFIRCPREWVMDERAERGERVTMETRRESMGLEREREREGGDRDDIKNNDRYLLRERLAII